MSASHAAKQSSPPPRNISILHNPVAFQTCELGVCSLAVTCLSGTSRQLRQGEGGREMLSASRGCSVQPRGQAGYRRAIPVLGVGLLLHTSRG